MGCSLGPDSTSYKCVWFVMLRNESKEGTFLVLGGAIWSCVMLREESNGRDILSAGLVLYGAA
jgi:hypothetical protein